MQYNFDRVSDQYDATREMPPAVAEQICEWVLSRLPPDPFIVEFGAGTGRIALPFILRNIRYTGFDISEKMTARLKAKLGGNLRRASLFLADVTEPLPVPDQSCDAVLAVHILHLVDPTKALLQARRILKPGGALVWGYEHYDALPRLRIRGMVRQIAAELGAPPGRDFTVPEARRLLDEWGAHHSQHVVAVWRGVESPREVLQTLRDRLISFTWDYPDHVLREAVDRAEAWAREEFGDLDRSYPVEQRFTVDWYRFEGGQPLGSDCSGTVHPQFQRRAPS